MIKYRDPAKTWKMIDRKEFHRLCKHWIEVRKAERLADAVEAEEVDPSPLINGS